MEGRHRSPSYPSSPLGEAIEIARRLHQVERTNTVDREVAAKAIGYSGISGRSATVLSNLIQYGLIERAGKNEVRVTARLVEILHPDSDDSFAAALHEAANEPALFEQISERFPNGTPSEAALESFLVKRGFTFAAIPPAIKAYLETFRYIENITGSGSHPHAAASALEAQSNQQIESAPAMNQLSRPPVSSPAAPTAATLQAGPTVNFAQKRIALGGVIETQAEADELIATINALKAFLKPAEAVNLLPPPPESEEDYQK